jgi:hypothetical protein
MPQLRGLDGRIPPSIGFFQRGREPLHHPFDFYRIDAQGALENPAVRIEDLISYAKQHREVIPGLFPSSDQVPRIYTERYGWSPGDWHSVLFFGFRGDGLVAMGEPTPGVGREN